jgi:serine/threonine-protein kinase HipA
VLDLETRSLLQVLYYISHGVDIPPDHQSQGLVRVTREPSGREFDWTKVLVGLKGNRIIPGQAKLPDGYEPWMVKFAARADLPDAGPIEYAYAQMAINAGIRMEKCRLMKVDRVRRYFAVSRFDRLPGNGRVHLHTFGNLIHANFRVPSNDYVHLLKITHALTYNHSNVLRAYQFMLFNVAAYNRDDHAKTVAFLMDENGHWSFSPAYDLTYAPGPGGEHDDHPRRGSFTGS